MRMRYSHSLTHKTTKVPSSEYQKSKVEIKVYPTLVLYGFCSLLAIGMAGIGFWCKWLLYILFCLKSAHSHGFNTYYSCLDKKKKHIILQCSLPFWLLNAMSQVCHISDILEVNENHANKSNNVTSKKKKKIKPYFWINFLFIYWTLIKL